MGLPAFYMLCEYIAVTKCGYNKERLMGTANSD